MNGSQTWEPMESQYLLEESVERKKYPGIYLFDLQQSSQMFMSIGVIQLTLRSPQSLLKPSPLNTQMYLEVAIYIVAR